jgi:hypothetical protein
MCGIFWDVWDVKTEECGNQGKYASKVQVCKCASVQMSYLGMVNISSSTTTRRGVIVVQEGRCHIPSIPMLRSLGVDVLDG